MNVKDRHFMYGFGSDIDRELRRVYQRMLGEIVGSLVTTQLCIIMLLFSQPPLPSIHKLIYQCLHHTVHPTNKECALEINFGTAEYGAALGRPFKQVCS